MPGQNGTTDSSQDAFALLLASNPWELYSSEPGWETAEVALNAAFDTAVLRMKDSIRQGTSPEQAVYQVQAEMWEVMRQPEMRRFGSMDTEPRAHLAWKLNKLAQDYDDDIEIDSTGPGYR